MTPATMLTYDRIEQPIVEWALDYGITPEIIIGRLERGMSIADAITTPMKVGHRGQRLPIYSRKQMAREKKRKTASRLRYRQKHTVNGHCLTLHEWANELGITYNALCVRMNKHGSLAAAVSFKRGRNPMSRAELAREGGVEPRTVESRLRRGWPLELAMAEPPFSRMGRHAHGRPGVSSNFAPSKGTGGGSALQDSPEITFSEKVENA
ncbi:hypothetical protein [Phyllobacterium sp. SB3]|uniref:hypothetical protein n=1 Tax=Phyllobacterium sp. SB3 TaxID=3156073 RepID=UPI0032AF64BE